MIRVEQQHVLFNSSKIIIQKMVGELTSANCFVCTAVPTIMSSLSTGNCVVQSSLCDECLWKSCSFVYSEIRGVGGRPVCQSLYEHRTGHRWRILAYQTISKSLQKLQMSPEKVTKFLTVCYLGEK